MTQTQRISDPDQLAKLATESLGTESSSSLDPQRVVLALLQPLAHTDMLTACRNPASRVMRDGDGNVCGPSNHEILDIQPLGLAWRKALVAIPPLPMITFDVRLPLPPFPAQDADTNAAADTSSDPIQKVYWDTTIPSKGGIGVRTQDLWNLAVTIATVMKIRVKGRCPVSFDAIYDPKDDDRKGDDPTGLKDLEKRLAALSEWGSP